MFGLDGNAKLVCAVFAVAVFVGCNNTALQNKRPSPDASGPASLNAEQSARVLARVGQTTITVGDYADALLHLDEFDRLRYQSAERRKEFLNEMIDVELLAQEAVAKGYDQSPMAQQEVREALRDAMLAESHKSLGGPEAIPEAEVQAYFAAHRSNYRDPERRRISVIVVSSETKGVSALAAARKATTGIKWGEVVRADSIESAGNGPLDLAGDLGFVSPPGDPRGGNERVPEEVRRAAFEIGAVGDVLGRLVEVGAPDASTGVARWYVVRLTQKSEAHERSFSEAERSIRIKLAQEKLQAADEKLLRELAVRYPLRVE